MVDTDGALVVSCFPSIGMVSSIVAHYLIERLELRLVGGVKSAGLPPVCLVENGAPLPPIRFYAGEPICNMEGCDKLVLIVSELQVPNELCLELSDALLEWSKRAKVGAGVLIDAFPREGESGEEGGEDAIVLGGDEESGGEDGDEETPKLLGVGATAHVRQVLETMEIPLLQQGMLGGMTGVLLGEGRRRGLDMMAVLAEAQRNLPDARAAANVIAKLDQLLPAIKLDNEPLVREAERLEQHLMGIMSAQLGGATADGDDVSHMYG